MYHKKILTTQTHKRTFELKYIKAKVHEVHLAKVGAYGHHEKVVLLVV